MTWAASVPAAITGIVTIHELTGFLRLSWRNLFTAFAMPTSLPWICQSSRKAK